MIENYKTHINSECSAEMKTDYELETFGTYDLETQLNDTLADVLNRYMKEKRIGTGKLHKRSGVSKCMISRYRHGTAKYINADSLYAICIALRLRPCQQRQLLKVAGVSMPDEWGKDRNRAFIIRDFLDGCYYDARYTVYACNARLSQNNLALLTNLVPKAEGKDNG